MTNNMKDDLKLFNKIVKAFLNAEKKEPVTRQIPPEKIFSKLDLNLEYEPAKNQKFIDALKDLVLATPKTSSELFFNQLFGGRHSKAVLGELLAVLLNNSMATYKIAGPQIGVEKQIINKICNLIGYGPESGGTFPTGGSMSNFMSLIIARDIKEPSIRLTGDKKKLVLYTSECGHYSVTKNISFSGIGRQNIRYIKSNSKGQMCVKDLTSQISKDISKKLTPFYVNATAGTTVLGAFDPINEIAKVCNKYNLWLHVDGAYSGTAIFSQHHRKLLKGIHLSDSFCFNAHKTLGAPLSCSILLVKNKNNLKKSFDNQANYLYQTHENLEEFNLGRTSFECGRKNNALKFWTLWKAVGERGISEMVDHEFYLANFAREYIKKNRDYTLYSESNTLSVCFNYRNLDAIDLCAKLYEKNILMVGHGTFKKDTFIRMVTVNANNNEEKIMQFFSILEAFANENYTVIKKNKCLKHKKTF